VSRKFRIAIFGAGLLLFAWLVARVGPEALLADARRVGWMIVPILLVYAVVYAGFATAWWITLGDAPRRPRFTVIYSITVSGFALNYLTPFVNLGGEPYKAAAVSAAVGKRHAAGSIVVYNVLHTLSHVLIWLIAITLAFAMMPRSPLLTAALALAGAVLLVLLGLLLSARRTGLLGPVLAVLRRIPFARRLREAVEARREALEEVDRQIVGFFRARPGRFALALGVDMLSRAFSFLEFWLIFLAVGQPEPLWRAFVIGGFSTLILNVLFFVPFEMGSREGGLLLLFQLFGLGPALCVFTVIVNRLRQVVWIATGLAVIGLSGRRAAIRQAPELTPRRLDTTPLRAEDDAPSN
jgi:uncharacterized protein (TIRG00374 family)